MFVFFSCLCEYCIFFTCMGYLCHQRLPVYLRMLAYAQHLHVMTFDSRFKFRRAYDRHFAKNYSRSKRSQYTKNNYYPYNQRFDCIFVCLVLLSISSRSFLQRKMAPRCSLKREFKLESVRWYHENGKNINKHQTILRLITNTSENGSKAKTR